MNAQVLPLNLPERKATITIEVDKLLEILRCRAKVLTEETEYGRGYYDAAYGIASLIAVYAIGDLCKHPEVYKDLTCFDRLFPPKESK